MKGNESLNQPFDTSNAINLGFKEAEIKKIKFGCLRKLAVRFQKLSTRRHRKTQCVFFLFFFNQLLLHCAILWGPWHTGAFKPYMKNKFIAQHVLDKTISETALWGGLAYGLRGNSAFYTIKL